MNKRRNALDSLLEPDRPEDGMRLGYRLLLALLGLLSAALVAAAAGLLFVACASHDGHTPLLVLQAYGDTTAQARAEAWGTKYVAASQPIPSGPVKVIYYPPTPQFFSSPGSHTNTEGSGPTYKVVCWCAKDEDLPHELRHAAELWAGTLGDPDHLASGWQSALLWPPGSRRPAHVVAAIGP